MTDDTSTFIPTRIAEAYQQTPEPFFKSTCQGIGVVVHDCNFDGLNVGYEDGNWRFADFSEYLMEWLPEFALCTEEYRKIQGPNARKFLRRAAMRVYKTDESKKRGEIGELALHALLRELYHSVPAISKVYFKTAVNDTVKGFDAAHIVDNDGRLELWLGESKFYTNIHQAITSVVKELEDHSKTDYLKSEFVLIEDKVDSSWKEANTIHQLLSQRKSLDSIFNDLRFPVLLTYESPTVQSTSTITREFVDRLVSELQKHHLDFTNTLNNSPAQRLAVHLFLLPLADKEKLVKTFDEN